GCAAEAMVAQVVGEDVVPAIVQDFVVGHEVDFESVAARGPVPMPGLKVSGNAGPAEAQRMVGDDQLVRPWRRNEPGLERYAVMRGERDVLVLEAVLGRRVEDRGSAHPAEAVGEALQRLVELRFGGMDFVLNGGHRPLLSFAVESSGARRSVSDPRGTNTRSRPDERSHATALRNSIRCYQR